MWREEEIVGLEEGTGRGGGGRETAEQWVAQEEFLGFVCWVSVGFSFFGIHK